MAEKKAREEAKKREKDEKDKLKELALRCTGYSPLDGNRRRMVEADGSCRRAT